jgi:predicted Holliday junction resolvase-like endonuclease
LHTNKPISPDAVVCHGCKDGSLAQLILDELKGGKTSKLRPDPDPIDGADEVTPRFDTSELVFPKTRKRKKLEEAV